MQAEKKFDVAEELFDWAQSLVFVFVAVVLVFSFGVSIFSVSQQSMTDTLQDGNMVIISRLPYRPGHGDVVLFTKYGWPRSFNHDTGQYNPMVKRIIGIEGDDITYDEENGRIIRNGIILDEPYISEPMRRWGAITQAMPYPFTVPEGFVFVAGDNRNNSHDSRAADIGFVDNRSILGPVILRLSRDSGIGRINR
jgi:signal peptidase I